MKIIISLFILVILCQFTMAQYPETLNHNSLVNAADLGEDFLLFIPDTTTQILINPARAVAYEKSFIYVNYNYSRSSSVPSIDYIRKFSYISEEIRISEGDVRLVRSRPVYLSGYSYNYYSTTTIVPDISIVSLFNAFDSKWLINFTHGINYLEDEREGDDTRIYSYDLYDDERYANSSQSSYRKTEDSNTEIVLSKIGSSGFGNYSIGLFASYKQDNIHTKDNYYNNSRLLDYSSYTNRVSKYTSNRDNNRTTDIQNYQMGLSYSLNSKNTDFIGRLSYHSSDILDQFIDYEFYNRSDSTTNDTIPEYLYTRNTKIIEDINLKNKYSPGSYLIDNYLQRKVDLINDNDNVFIRLNGFYSTDEKSYQYDGRIIHKSDVYYHDSDYLSNIDTITIDNNGIQKLENWAIKFSMGYLSSYQLEDIFFLIGLNPSFQLIHLEDVNTDASIIESMNELKNISLKVPVYLNYSPKSWIEIYGGLNYYYTYRLSDWENEYIALREITTDVLREEIRKISRSSETLSSSKSSYLGVNLKHKSGLRCMINFRSDITSYKTWNISLGYHF